MNKKFTYQVSPVVRIVCLLLPRSRQEEFVNQLRADELGENKKVKKVVKGVFYLLGALFCCLTAMVCWAFPLATPLIVAVSLGVVWWGYGVLGWGEIDYEVKEWISQVAHLNDDSYCMNSTHHRWEHDLILIFGRPESLSEIQGLWLTQETPCTHASPARPRL